MSFDLNQLVRKHILTLKPYSSAREEYTGRDGIFLDANENPIGSAGNENVNRYPDPFQREIKQRLAQLKGVEIGQIFLGNGSDEAIDLLFRVFCEPAEDHVLLLPPTYGMYQVSADINQIETRKINLTSDYQLDMPAVLKALDDNPKITFICSPNNPTGNLIYAADIEQVLNNAKGLVVIDEAYADFAPKASWVPHLKKHVNLLVLQTFSKAWGLANIRLGMAFAHPDMISLLNKVKPPYNISGLTQQAALKALSFPEEKDDMVRQLIHERKKLAESLEKLKIVEKIHPSDANFLLVKMERANEIYHNLIKSEIIIRNRSTVVKCEGCLRITIGTPSENEQLIEALKNLS